MVSGYGRTAEIAVNVWNENHEHAAEKSLVPGTPEPGPIPGDMLIVPENIKNIMAEKPLQSLLYGAGFYDTSEYMIGDVSVGIILLK